MKTIRITLVKEGAQAACTQQYRVTEWPSDISWAGNREAFRFPDGTVIEHFGGLDNLQRVAEHFARLCGATFTIEDLGGEALFALNPICGPADPPE